CAIFRGYNDPRNALESATDTARQEIIERGLHRMEFSWKIPDTPICYPGKTKSAELPSRRSWPLVTSGYRRP
ncbi:hypothetical protein K0M31_011738, partial [Melipona bicolor]